MDIGALLIVVMELIRGCRDENDLSEQQLRERLLNRRLGRWALRRELRRRGHSKSEIKDAMRTAKRWNPTDEDLEDVLTSALED